MSEVVSGLWVERGGRGGVSEVVSGSRVFTRNPPTTFLIMFLDLGPNLGPPKV